MPGTTICLLIGAGRPSSKRRKLLDVFESTMDGAIAARYGTSPRLPPPAKVPGRGMISAILSPKSA